MRIAHSCVLGLFIASSACAQNLIDKQPSIWSTKPDVVAFEKIENDRLAAAQRSIDRIAAGKPPRTVANTLGAYDEAIRQLNAAGYFSSLMEAVHPDAAFRDRATAMTRKVSAMQTELSLNRDAYQALAAVDVSRSDPRHPVLPAAAVARISALRSGQGRRRPGAAEGAQR